ncbi:MAG: type II toxin-antitoxin system VapC family toxin [Spirochaetia bacterium]
MTFLLDTSVYSQPLKKQPRASVVRRWKRAGDVECCVSVFCEMEIFQGLALAGSVKLRQLYDDILRDRIVILPFTPAEAEIYADLQARLTRQGRCKPVIDLCIAATAIHHQLILATLNAKDFTDIPSLRFEAWD